MNDQQNQLHDHSWLFEAECYWQGHFYTERLTFQRSRLPRWHLSNYALALLCEEHSCNVFQFLLSVNILFLTAFRVRVCCAVCCYYMRYCPIFFNSKANLHRALYAILTCHFGIFKMSAQIFHHTSAHKLWRSHFLIQFFLCVIRQYFLVFNIQAISSLSINR